MNFISEDNDHNNIVIYPFHLPQRLDYSYSQFIDIYFPSNERNTNKRNDKTRERMPKSLGSWTIEALL
jgi:hypothetical protein